MINEHDIIQKVKISELDINDPFFDSLRFDYNGFDQWLLSKADEYAYVLFADNQLEGFLLLKDETENDPSISPHFKYQRRLKISTFKINSHGTILGQRFINIILRTMIEEQFDTTYVTLFDKRQGLIKLFEKYGFKIWGNKDNGEIVYVKTIKPSNDIYYDYPMINLENKEKYLLSIYPKYHTKMFPNSKLHTEKDHKVEDLSFTNTIEKIYIAGMREIPNLKKGNLLVIYRTQDRSASSAEYSSVATSICTVIDIRDMNTFQSLNDYLEYCGKGSVFSKSELTTFYNRKKYPYIIKMLYNFPLNRRIIRKELIEEVGLEREAYFGLLELTDEQFINILEKGEVNEGFIFD